jgi:hypothetical protein
VFRSAIDSAYRSSQLSGGNTGFTNAIAALDAKRITTSLSGAFSSYDRAKNILWDKYYVSFITILKNPSIVITTNPISTGTSTNPPSSTPTTKPNLPQYTLVDNYITASQKTYNIRSTSNGKYRFQKTGKN